MTTKTLNILFAQWAFGFLQKPGIHASFMKSMVAFQNSDKKLQFF